MIQAVIAHNNIDGAEKFRRLKEEIKGKYPQAMEVFFNEENVSPQAILDIAGQRSFLSETCLVACHRIFENEETEGFFLEIIEAAASSPNQYLFFENELDKKRIALMAEKGRVYELKKPAEEEKFNVFRIGNALGMRDRRTAWIELMRARRAGLGDENILRALVWQAKCMLLASKTSLSSSGLNPYVYQKSKRYVSNYSPDELNALSFQLVILQPRVIAGETEMETALESLVLNI